MALSGQATVLPHSQPLQTEHLPRGSCWSSMGCGPLGYPGVEGSKAQPPGWKPVPEWGLTGACLSLQATGRRCPPSHEHPSVGDRPQGAGPQQHPCRIQAVW